jgi:general secretion pathway protein C
LNLNAFYSFLDDRRLIFGIGLLLVLALSWQLSRLAWLLVPSPELAPVSERMPGPEQRGGTTAAPRGLEQKVARIAAANLFGKLETRGRSKPAPVREAPKSTLNYKLRGIYYSEDKALASAIVQKGAGKSGFYRLGDEIDSGIYIDRILPDHILISRNGRLEKLVLEKPKAKPGSGRAQAGRSLAVPAAANANRVLKSYKRRYADNPLALAKRFQAIPVTENGRNVGYKLKALRGERLLQRLGLREDDVFVEINGIGLDKPFQALDALKSLSTAEDVSITVLRNGDRQTLNFSLNQ